MRLVEFSVTNYRSITSAHKIALKNLTVLVGKNNEGKSNLLRALNVAMNAVISHSRNGGRPLNYHYKQLEYDWHRDFPIQYQERTSGLESIFRLNFRLEDGELNENSSIRNFKIIQKEGNREVLRDIKHYNLQMIIAVGFKVNNQKAVQFRKWANQIVKDYTIQGWAIDDERLKNSGTILTKDYFDKLLEKIREIRLSERRFYQKVTDIYATSIDYDKDAKITYDFFKKVQNKMHYAVHGNTAAEIIYIEQMLLKNIWV